MKFPLEGLPHDKVHFLTAMIEALIHLKGVEGIVLGGSYAKGYAALESDVDLGIYYSEKSPPRMEEIRSLAKQFDAASIATDFYEWGPWVNGGAWLSTQVGEVDRIYRNLDQVHRVIDDAEKGRFSWDFRQQPPYGYFSVTYLADEASNRILTDPRGVLSQLKRRVQTYPKNLQKAIVQEHLWSVEFTLFHAEKLAKRNDVYGTLGCMTRMCAELTQVLFALNLTYFSTERTALQQIDAFPLKPTDYRDRITEILSKPEDLLRSVQRLKQIVQETVSLARALYTPKYQI